MTTNRRVASAAALVMACGGLIACGGVNDGAGDRAEALHSESQADSVACVEGTTASGWADGGIGTNSGTFSVELDATPNSTDEDALFGLAAQAPATYADLAAIVRFNTDGKLDARDGGTYHATTDVSYAAGQTHHLRFDVDTANHTYSVTDLSAPASPVVASGFGFRSEQASAGSLSAYGVKVDAGGPLDVCNVIVENQSCLSASAHQGFVNVPFTAQDVFVTVEFDATPSAANIDAVMGVSTSAASSFNDIAAAVRFNPDGGIDARDGDVYRPVGNAGTYAAGVTHHFILFLDVLAHEYSVVVDEHQIAEHLAFRTQQANTNSLGNLVIESDGDTGTVTRCAATARPAHDAVYMHLAPPPAGTVLPLSDARYLVVQASQSLVFDDEGAQTVTTDMRAPLAADAASNIYGTGTFSGTFDAGTGPLTSAGGVDAYVVKYDERFVPVWSERFGGTGDDTIGAPVVNAEGDVVFVLDGKLVRLDPQGNVVYDSASVSSGATLALAPDGSVFASDDPPVAQALSITKLDPAGNTTWTHVMPIVEGDVNMRGLAADAEGGAVFAGEIDGRFDLGGTTFTQEAGEDGPQTYIAKLDGTGAYVYANATSITRYGGLVTDTHGHAAVSGMHENPFEARIDQYDANGSLLREIGGGTLIPSHDLGTADAAAGDWAGNLYFSFDTLPYSYGPFFAKISAL